MLDVLATVSGVALLVVLAREVFQQLLHPEARGSIGHLIMRGCRRVARHMGPKAMVLAGPVAIGLVFVTWMMLSIFGWALLLLPHVPDGFDYGTSKIHAPMLDAIYISTVTVSTLGYGDIVPAAPWLRIVAPLQSVMGFGLLTATLTWMLSLHVPLARLRTLARRSHQLLARDGHDVRQVHDLASMITAAAVDLRLNSTIYYFHATEERECFARVALPLWDLARTRTDDAGDSAEFTALLVALEQFAEALGEDLLPLVRDADTRTIFAAYVRDAGRDAAFAGVGDGD